MGLYEAGFSALVAFAPFFSLVMVCACLRHIMCSPITLTTAGKGMHDGAGAWLKSAVARACLAGVGISTAQDFFQYCSQFLATNATKSNFTSERHFYLISIETAAMYRATMPAKITGIWPVVVVITLKPPVRLTENLSHQNRHDRLVFLGDYG